MSEKVIVIVGRKELVMVSGVQTTIARVELEDSETRFEARRVPMIIERALNLVEVLIDIKWRKNVGNGHRRNNDVANMMKDL